jgi:hypothetical protein
MRAPTRQAVRSATEGQFVLNVARLCRTVTHCVQT